MITDKAQLLLVGAVAMVGVLHTMVPDHWAPIAFMARQKGWSRAQTIGAALRAGTGHVLSTLAIALVVWFAGMAVAARFGHYVDLASSIALIAFGLWIAVASWLEMHEEEDDDSRGHSHDHGDGHHHVHSHSHEHGHSHGHGHASQTGQRTALLLILGSSPMVEGIPAFFAAGKYGVGLIAAMSVVFALSTILTYVVLCVGSAEGLQRVKFGPFERYGEVLSGTFIAATGLVFWLWPVL